MKSFFSDRPDSAFPALRPLADTQPEASSLGGAKPGATGHAHQPAVECIKQGDKVTRLIVTCACGERIEIDCLYTGPR